MKPRMKHAGKAVTSSMEQLQIAAPTGAMYSSGKTRPQSFCTNIPLISFIRIHKVGFSYTESWNFMTFIWSGTIRWQLACRSTKQNGACCQEISNNRGQHHARFSWCCHHISIHLQNRVYIYNYVWLDYLMAHAGNSTDSLTETVPQWAAGWSLVPDRNSQPKTNIINIQKMRETQNPCKQTVDKPLDFRLHSRASISIRKPCLQPCFQPWCQHMILRGVAHASLLLMSNKM